MMGRWLNTTACSFAWTFPPTFDLSIYLHWNPTPPHPPNGHSKHNLTHNLSNGICSGVSTKHPVPNISTFFR
ncbi:hypothetical protein BofuT4_uP143510.1 [Botrytis cinerea T4]|uniref:Uncharacterized protein n=1 Tax=Botryotinia fuckeliana (strain T4) TaxID=999810 RepID=G2YZP1_BOTF4|nr:hypothetical protein BofuT4_uP143510.1 [Botrytis cinerea T4]